MEKKKQGIGQKIGRHWRKALVIFLIILAMAAAAFLPRHLSMGRARRVLNHAKSVRLATQVTYYDYYKSDEPFFTEDARGIEEAKAAEILKLAQCGGDIYQVRFDETTFRVSSLIYIESGYAAEFADGEGEAKWKVYKLEEMIHN